jgi:hypothetical protein
MHDSRPPRPSRFPLLALVLLAGGAFLGGAWRQDLWSSREGRVAACAQAMIDSGDWVEPRLGDEFRAKKPPLAYWLVAVCGAALGGHVTPLVAKLPSVLAGLATVLALFALGTRALASRRAGFFAALALAGTFRFWDEAHTSAADMLMTCSVTLAVFGFWRVLETPVPSRLDRALPWLAMGLGFLAKGPVAPAVPLLAVGGLLVFSRRWRDLRLLAPGWPGTAAFLLTALPWFLLVLWRHPDAFEVWIKESFGRMSPGNDSHRDTNPLSYLLGEFWGAAMPWALLVPALLAAVWLRRRAGRPLPPGLLLGLGWAGLGLALFSAAFSKRGYYLLPIMPGLALCWGWLLDELSESRLPPLAEKLVRAGLGLIGAVMAAAPALAAFGPLAAAWPAGMDLHPVPVLLLGAAGLAVLLMSLAPSRRGWPLVECALVSVVCALAWGGLAVQPAFNARKSPAAFAREVLRRVPREQRIAVVDSTDFPLMVFYLGPDRVVRRKRRDLGRTSQDQNNEAGWVVCDADNIYRLRAGAAVVHDPGGSDDDRPVLLRLRLAPEADGGSGRD